MSAMLTFDDWLRYVDMHMVRAVGLNHRDIADWTWYDAYEAGVSPVDAAREAINADGLF